MKIQNTITMHHARRRHTESCYRTLSECYGTYSRNKELAMLYCKQLCRNYDGYDLRIISFNSFMFTVGFYGFYEGKFAFFYITPKHDYVNII